MRTFLFPSLGVPLVARALAGLVLLTVAPGLRAADLYVSPQGAGRLDGSSREHAASAAGDGLQKMWDALPTGATLWLAPGEYAGVTLDMGKGSRNLAGEDVDGKRAVFSSDFDRKRPEKTGAHVITVRAGVSDWSIRHVEFRDVNTAIHLQGGHERGVIEKVRVTRAREGIRSEGRGRGKAVSKALEVRGCEFLHYTKRGLRLLAGHEGVKVEGCRADAGGKDWDVEPFQMGFAVEAGCTDVVFVDCEARGSHHDHGKGYWNGDGFCAESGAGTVTWKRCRAFDNTDGGWDTKADLSLFEDCVALRNKRNYRVWGRGVFKNCLGAFPMHPGGSGGTACVWSKGEVSVEGCTLVGDNVLESEEGGSFTLVDSLVVSLPGQDGRHVDLPALQGSKKSELKQVDAAGLERLFRAASPSYERGDGFDRRDAGEGKAGFQHARNP